MNAPQGGRGSQRSAGPGPELILGNRIGWTTGVDAEGRLLVDFEGSPTGPLPAQTTIALTPDLIQEAVSTRQRVVLIFENGNPGLPVIMGFIQPAVPTPLLSAVLAESSREAGEPMDVSVDGASVTIEGQDEVVLKCGKASITLRRNGKIILKGTYVESHATGTNRIKGGSVQVN
ncbi:DUF6484 domain-containing protein [Myxococcus sp. NMCA1]|uniref:DUF6484 domain-containing protein n=1 Tax=Myxococcus sp. NMCA1 TaxID=2996785 RepID=UPI002285FC4E|nr:DUF6484 domain-containing protein [Myxococcus sp. NMCA1]WAM25722.1 DUF6484 domain-containing protein [Myxococcus sp. NMCA1]